MKKLTFLCRFFASKNYFILTVISNWPLLYQEIQEMHLDRFHTDTFQVICPIQSYNTSDMQRHCRYSFLFYASLPTHTGIYRAQERLQNLTFIFSIHQNTFQFTSFNSTLLTFFLRIFTVLKGLGYEGLSTRFKNMWKWDSVIKSQQMRNSSIDGFFLSTIEC